MCGSGGGGGGSGRGGGGGKCGSQMEILSFMLDKMTSISHTIVHLGNAIGLTCAVDLVNLMYIPYMQKPVVDRDHLHPYS